MLTHYVPAFCEQNGRYQRAVCGVWIIPGQHSAEPTCEECQAYVQAQAADTRTAEDVFGEPDPSQVVPHHEFNPIDGYKPREKR